MSDNPTPEDDTEKRVRPFADVLVELNRGRTHGELSKQMQDLVAAVIATGRKGAISLVISVAKSKANGQVEITDDIRVKTPSVDRAASIFFVDDDANLTRTDPYQQELAFPRDVSADRPERTREAK